MTAIVASGGQGSQIASPGARSYRVESLDLLRGLVIVIMALDHVRDFMMLAAAQDPLVDPDVTPGLFFTRWITHFCAPVFVLLAGVSAGLMTARRAPPALGVFLATRGLWLIAVEIFVVSTGVTFAPFGLDDVSGRVFVSMQVIWAIGVSMIVLAAAQFLGQRACLAIGGALLLGHNLLDPVWPATGGPMDVGPPIWVALHSQMALEAGPFLLAFVYPVLPWIALMLFGFGVAPLWAERPAIRDARLLRWGLATVAAFVALRLSGVYGDANPWHIQGSLTRTLLDFLNVTKYPPSLLFLLMTLGPAALLCAYAARIPQAIARVLVTFGRVPFAFYVAHVYLIHVLAMVLGVVQGFDAREFLTIFFFYPGGYGVGLGAVYALWLLVIVLLYPWCRWIAAVKERRRDWWLSYV